MSYPWSTPSTSWPGQWFPSGSEWMQPWGGQQRMNSEMMPYGGSGSPSSMMPFDVKNDRAFSSELTYQPSRPASMLEQYSLMHPIRVDPDGNRRLNVYFDLRSYKPEEVDVTIDPKNRCISVEASHEINDSKEHYIKRHYSRKMYLPEELKVDLSKIEPKSCLTNEGLLCIEASLPRFSVEEGRVSTSKILVTGAPGTVFPINVKTI